MTTTATRYRPLNLAAWEVRAIREGRKTQTRRLVKPQPLFDDLKPYWTAASTDRKSVGKWKWGRRDHIGSIVTVGDIFPCPFGQPGDLLWLRETFCDRADYGSLAKAMKLRIAYAADGTEKREGWKWRPSTQMPRWASRETLRIKSVRIERLQEISEADAIAEGARPLPLQSADDPSAWWEIDFGQHQCRTPRGVIRSLWQSSWDANPWVWVIEHERITK